MHKLKIINNRRTQEGNILVRTDSNPDWTTVTEEERSIDYQIKSTDKWLNFILDNVKDMPLFMSASTKKARIFSVGINELNSKNFGISFPLDSLYPTSETGELIVNEDPPENIEVGEDPPESTNE